MITHRTRFRQRYLLAVLVLAIGIVLSLLLWFRPGLLAAYNVERAGRLMDVGLGWPEPRLVDSLPSSRNPQALEQALGHLAAAIRWQPGAAYAYRMAGRIYVAQQAWPQAAEAFEQAQARDGNNALLAWERALVYKQLLAQLHTSPGENLLPALEQAELEAPSTPITTPFCRDGRPETCYSARTTLAQPSGTAPDAPEAVTNVIFLHPPATLRLLQPISPSQSTLVFQIGLDPRAREWGSDGIGIQILVQDKAGLLTSVYDTTLDAETVTRGWTAATVDLAAWAGKTVTLSFRTTAGGAYNTTADWAVWSNVRLIPDAQARLALLMPETRLREAWAESGAPLQWLQDAVVPPTN